MSSSETKKGAETILKTGWGVKQGSKVKNWKRRWFVLLNDGKLRYFVDKYSPEEQGRVLIDLHTTILLPPAISEGYPLQIVSKSRTFTVAYLTKTEAEEWKDALMSLKDNL